MSEQRVDNLPGGLLKALEAITASEKGRYALNCVCVDGDKLAAADGDKLGVVTLPGKLTDEKRLYRVSKPSQKKRNAMHLNCKNGHLEAEQDEGGSKTVSEKYGQANDGAQFPDYESVIPEKGKGATVMFDIGHLEKCLELIKSAGHERVGFTIPSNHTASRLDADGTGDVGVLIALAPTKRDKEPERTYYKEEKLYQERRMS